MSNFHGRHLAVLGYNPDIFLVSALMIPQMFADVSVARCAAMDGEHEAQPFPGTELTHKGS